MEMRDDESEGSPDFFSDDGAIEVKSSKEYSVAESARAMGFTGDICTTCGSSQMVRNGTCLKCNECGETTGCS